MLRHAAIADDQRWIRVENYPWFINTSSVTIPYSFMPFFAFLDYMQPKPELDGWNAGGERLLLVRLDNSRTAHEICFRCTRFFARWMTDHTISFWELACLERDNVISHFSREEKYRHCCFNYLIDTGRSYQSCGWSTAPSSQMLTGSARIFRTQLSVAHYPSWSKIWANESRTGWFCLSHSPTGWTKG